MKGPTKTNNIWAGKRIQRWTQSATAISTAATHSIIAASNGNEHVIKDLVVYANATGAVTATINLGATAIPVKFDSGLRTAFSLAAEGLGEWFCGNNAAVSVALDAAVACVVVVRYATVQHVA